MKAKIIPIITLVILVIISNSCEDSIYKEYTGYEPVYLSYDDLRSAIDIADPVDLVNPGKIYFKDDYIFIIEERKGIHIFDNTNPTTPDAISFIKVPGVMDISIAGFYMYADSYVDLVVLDIEDPLNVSLEARIKDVFPYFVPPHDNDYPNAYIDEEKGVVDDWILTTIVEKVNYSPRYYPIFAEIDGLFSSNMPRSGGTISGGGVGIGGSMSRFGIRQNVLYVVNSSSMNIFDITNPSQPVEYDELQSGWGIETMFIDDDKMFLGTTTGMIIYDLAIKFRPSRLSFFRHARSCDPVIVDGDIAYVTLRSGTTCGGDLNTLDLVDISSLTDPELIISYPMFNPHGLGKDGDLLFICDGSEGLKVYDSSNSLTITDNLVYSYPLINAFDVIPLGDVLIMIGDDGLAQYDYSDPGDISLLSIISATN